MLNSGFPPWPSFSEEEIAAVAEVLRSGQVNYWTGELGRDFESAFAQWVGAEHAVAVANGTLALELALKALEIGPGDEVVVTPRTFIASASSVVGVGATPVFADVDPDSQNITASTIRQVLGPNTKAIICVHLAGLPCDMDPILRLAEDNGLKVIEDCAQAHGASYKGRPVGALGDIGAWSFCQDKIMTTGGEGGMVTTNDPGLWRRMWAYKDHGKSWEAVYEREHPPGFRWLHESFGSNFRMTEMQAAIGLLQLEKMQEWHSLRRRNADILRKHFDGLAGIRVPDVSADFEHAWYKFYGFVRPENLASGWDRDRIRDEITSRGVPCFSGSCSEVYKEKAFVDAEMSPPRPLPQARAVGEISLMWLVHPTLQPDDMERMATISAGVIREAQG